MNRIAIVTDSTSDLPKKIIEENNITVVPLSVHFKGKTYIDNENGLALDAFYKKIRKSDSMPAAAQPTPGDFMKVYSNLLRDHQSIISIHISTKLSGTINSARLAKEQFTGSDIELVDSELVHMACGFMVLKAANMASRGEDKEIILKSLAGLRKKIKALFVPKTLENLIKGGRMSKLKGAFASLLEVKPILTLNDGEIELLKKTRKWEQAKAELIKSMREIVIGDKDLTVSVGDADNHSDAEEIVAFIEKEFRPRKIIRTGIGIVVGSHLAPGGIAVTFYQE